MDHKGEQRHSKFRGIQKNVLNPSHLCYCHEKKREFGSVRINPSGFLRTSHAVNIQCYSLFAKLHSRLKNITEMNH